MLVSTYQKKWWLSVYNTPLEVYPVLRFRLAVRVIFSIVLMLGGREEF